jgi:hypothetical protein
VVVVSDQKTKVCTRKTKSVTTLQNRRKKVCNNHPSNMVNRAAVFLYDPRSQRRERRRKVATWQGSSNPEAIGAILLEAPAKLTNCATPSRHHSNGSGRIRRQEPTTTSAGKLSLTVWQLTNGHCRPLPVSYAPRNGPSTVGCTPRPVGPSWHRPLRRRGPMRRAVPAAPRTGPQRKADIGGPDRASTARGADRFRSAPANVRSPSRRARHGAAASPEKRRSRTSPLAASVQLSVLAPPDISEKARNT